MKFTLFFLKSLHAINMVQAIGLQEPKLSGLHPAQRVAILVRTAEACNSARVKNQ